MMDEVQLHSATSTAEWVGHKPRSPSIGSHSGGVRLSPLQLLGMTLDAAARQFGRILPPSLRWFRYVSVSFVIMLHTIAVDSAACESTIVTKTVASVEDANALRDALLCTGRGIFEVSWEGSVEIMQTMYMTGGSTLFVTGGTTDAEIDGGEAVQLFNVNGSTLFLQDLALVRGFTEDDGGAVQAVEDSDVTVRSCNFTGNNASGNGGAISVGRNTGLVMDGHTHFIDNSATGSGGALSASVLEAGDMIFNGITEFVANTAGNFGGAIYAYFSSVVMHGETFIAGNVARWGGGGLYAGYVDVNITGIATRFVNNTSFQGGAMNAEAKSILIHGNTTFEDNRSSGDAGAILVTSNDITIDGDTYVASNIAGTLGGFISSLGGRLAIKGTAEFVSNKAGEDGGALYAIGTVDLEGAENFTRNAADGNGGEACTVRTALLDVLIGGVLAAE